MPQLFGLLIGEIFNLLSIAALSIHDTRRPVTAGRLGSKSTAADSDSEMPDHAQDTEVYERSA